MSELNLGNSRRALAMAGRSLRAARIRRGMADSIFAGATALRVPLRLLPSPPGSDPRSAVARAMDELVRDGGLAPRQGGARRAAGQ